MGRAAILALAVSREEAVEAELRKPGEPAVGLGVVDELPHARLPTTGREEALLEVEERVLAAACAAAEVELLEPTALSPAGRLEEHEVRGRRLTTELARPGDVVVEPGRRREAERRRGELAA